MTSKKKQFSHLAPQQIESFINKLLEQPFCHYQTKNNIQFSTENVSLPPYHINLIFFWFLPSRDEKDVKEAKKETKKVIKLIKPEKVDYNTSSLFLHPLPSPFREKAHL
jgi:hypothetical protein